MYNIGRLLNILQNADDIRRDIIMHNGDPAVANRMDLICGMAVAELVKEGIPHTTSNDGAYIIIETDGRQYVYNRANIASAKQAKDAGRQAPAVNAGPAKKTEEYNRPAENKPGENETVKEPEKEQISSEAPVSLNENQAAEEVKKAAGPNVSEEPDVDDGSEKESAYAEEGPVVSAEAAEEEGGAAEEPADDHFEGPEDETEPIDEDENEYPPCMHRDDFMLEYRRIVIRDNMDKKVCSVELISTPLYPGNPESPAILWAQHGKEAFTITVEPRTRQKIEVENVPFYYTFTYINGEFKSEVDLTNNYKQINYHIQLREYENMKGSKGHIVVADNDTKVHITPITFFNSKSHGNAEFMYCIESGGTIQCGETNGADHCEAEINGTTLTLVARWEPVSNILYAQVSG